MKLDIDEGVNSHATVLNPHINKSISPNILMVTDFFYQLAQEFIISYIADYCELLLLCDHILYHIIYL